MVTETGDVMTERIITTSSTMTCPGITNIIMTRERMGDIRDRDLDTMIPIEEMRKPLGQRLLEKLSLKVSEVNEKDVFKLICICLKNMEIRASPDVI